MYYHVVRDLRDNALRMLNSPRYGAGVVDDVGAPLPHRPPGPGNTVLTLRPVNTDCLEAP